MESDVALARRLASAAGELALMLRSDAGLGTAVGVPAEGEREARRRLRDAADRACHVFLVDALNAARPADAVLSEEGVDDEQRLSANRLWIVDPVDGTWEFGQGRPDFAVHVALWDATVGQLVAGAVAVPAEGVTYDTETVEAVPAEPEAGRPIRLVVSRSRPPRDIDAVVAGLSLAFGGQAVETYNVGSAGAKTAEVLAGRADAYLHDAGLSEWDVAAPAAVAAAAGLTVAHLDGSPVGFNAPLPLVGDLVIGRAAVVAALLHLTAAT